MAYSKFCKLDSESGVSKLTFFENDILYEKASYLPTYLPTYLPIIYFI